MGFLDDVIENAGEPYKGKGFEYGTHEVIIGEVKATEKKTKNDPNAPVIEITVVDPNQEDKSAICTLYFHTEGGAKMSVTKVLGIMVHNVGEEKKDKVREIGKKLFGSVSKPEQARDTAAKLLNDKMIGKKAYLVAEPRDNYKTTIYGEIWHYPAEPQGEPKDEAQAAAKSVGGAVEEASDGIPEFEDL